MKGLRRTKERFGRRSSTGNSGPCTPTCLGGFLMAAASPTWSTTGSPHKTTLVGIGIEAGCRDRVGNMTKPPLQEIDEVLLLLTGILIPPVVVAGLHHHLHARPLPRPRLAEANIDCLRTVTIHLCANTVHR